MRRIVFLDFDGVINGGFNRELGGKSGFDWSIPNAVLNLNKLLIKSGAKIVVSSSWRLKENWPDGTNLTEALTNQLVRFGIKRNLIDIIGITREDLLDSEEYPVARAVEIRHWITSNGKPDDNFIVIDDLDIFLDTNNETVVDEEIKSRLVKTNTKFGFSENDYEKSMRLFLAKDLEGVSIWFTFNR